MQNNISDYSRFFITRSAFSFREYSVGETLTYICFDSTLGVDAGPSNKIEYKCKHETPYILGEYDTPKDDGLWPVCQRKTTTVKPGKMRNVPVYSRIFVQELK